MCFPDHLAFAKASVIDLARRVRKIPLKKKQNKKNVEL